MKQSCSLPGLSHVTSASSAVDVQHVSGTADWVTHLQEVWTRTTDGELCQVGQRLADGCTKQEGAHHFVESRQVLVELGVGVETFGVHQVGLSCGDLWRKQITMSFQ